MRRKDDIHAAVFSSSLESGESLAHLPLGLGSETSGNSWKPEGRGNGAEELRVLFGLYAQACTCAGLEGSRLPENSLLGKGN